MCSPAGESNYVDAVVSANTRNLTREVEEQAHRFAYPGILMLGRAFDLGIISCGTLVRKLVQPFLKLARKVSSSSVATNSLPAAGGWGTAPWVDRLFLRWVDALDHVLYTGFERDRNGMPQPQLQAKKRAELKRALVKAGFAEVKSFENSMQ